MIFHWNVNGTGDLFHVTLADMNDCSGGVTIGLCRAADIPPGEMRRFQLEHLSDVAVYNVGGEFYITEDRCTHGGASLADEGALDGYIVECGLHLGSFDIRTGEGVAAPCRRRLRTYRVAVVDGTVVLRLTPGQAMQAGLRDGECE